MTTMQQAFDASVLAAAAYTTFDLSGGSFFPVVRLLWRPDLDRCAEPRGSGHSSTRKIGHFETLAVRTGKRTCRGDRPWMRLVAC
jgi:phage repressor protein C with HTH and peptisase S24 domain